MPHICVNESGQHGFMYWLVACSAPSHYLNQCCTILSIEPLGSNLNEILIKKQNSSLTKMHLKISSAKWRPFCSCLVFLNNPGLLTLWAETDGPDSCRISDNPSINIVDVGGWEPDRSVINSQTSTDFSIWCNIHVISEKFTLWDSPNIKIFFIFERHIAESQRHTLLYCVYL